VSWSLAGIYWYFKQPPERRDTIKKVASRNGVAVGRMIMAYSRGVGAATYYVIPWVTVAQQNLRVGGDSWARIDPVHRWLQTIWFDGRSSGTWRRPRPRWPWRAGSPVTRQCRLGRPRKEVTARLQIP
jgi:hypothetical protein